MAEIDPRPESPARRPRRALALAGALATAALALVLFATGETEPPAVPEPAATPAAEPAFETPPPPSAGGTLSVDSGQTLALSAASLPEARTLAVDLLFPEPSTSADPLPVRILAPDGRVLEIEAAVAGADRRRASIEIESAWLSPGRYIVELKTTERSHFPLRRYALEVHEP